ncbi:hypothetical protein M6B38_330260 [Iris pallida]|uniref:Uncharacterized protein n=1 Tax=Iris pallida TaxID=29817 RepID=A0AAX6H4Q8_IRIPA|nr:hypothetical protein M6B38_330260 [Iris pallida]
MWTLQMTSTEGEYSFIIKILACDRQPKFIAEQDNLHRRPFEEEPCLDIRVVSYLLLLM